MKKLDTFTTLSVLLLVAAIAHQLWRSHLSPGIIKDGALQIAAARSLLAGEGYGVRYSYPEDLSQSRTTWLLSFPPGYSLVMAAFLRFTDDYVLADLILKAVCSTVLLLVYYRMLTRFLSFLPTRVVLLVLLGWACGRFPAPLLSTPDTLALTLYTMALFLTLSVVENPPSLRRAFLVGLLLMGSAYVRYAYWTLTAVIPIFLGYRAVRRHPHSAVPAFCIGLTVLVGLLVLSVINYTYAGHATFVHVEAGTRFWWGNLGLLNQEFPQVALGGPEFWSLLETRYGNHFAQWGRPLLSICLFICIGHVAWPWRATEDPYSGAVDGKLRKAFWSLGALTVTVTAATLLILSLTHAPDAAPPWWKGPWTYCTEPRYYAPVWFFFLIAGVQVTTCWHPQTRGKRSALFIMRISLLGLYLFASCQQILISRQMALHPPPRIPVDKQAIIDEVKRLKQTNNSPIVVVTNHESLGDRLSDISVLEVGTAQGPPPPLHTSKPVTILFAGWTTHGAEQGTRSAEEIDSMAITYGARPLFTGRNLHLWCVEGWTGRHD